MRVTYGCIGILRGYVWQYSVEEALFLYLSCTFVGPRHLFHRTLQRSLEHVNVIMGLAIHLIRRRVEREDPQRPGINVRELASHELNITKRINAISSRNEQWEREFLDKLKKQPEPKRELQRAENFQEFDEIDTQDSECEDTKDDKNSADNKREDHKREERRQIARQMYENFEKQQMKQKALYQAMKLMISFQLFVLFCFVREHISDVSGMP